MGDLAHTLFQHWKRLLLAYSPPSSREEPEGGFLSDLSYSSEEEQVEEVVTVPPVGTVPPTAFNFIIIIIVLGVMSVKCNVYCQHFG